MPVPEPKVPGVFDYSPYRDRRGCHGRCQRAYCRRLIHRPTPDVLRTSEGPSDGCRQGRPRWGLAITHVLKKSIRSYSPTCVSALDEDLPCARVRCEI